MNQLIDTVIVGAGQAGLSASYYLKQHGREHIVIEKSNRPGHVWSDDRWDSFTLVTPNWSFQLPGAEYAGDDPGGFMHRDEVIREFQKYSNFNHLPISFNTEVLSISSLKDNFLVATNETHYLAKNIVVATGLYQQPRIPGFANDLPTGIFQIPATKYRNPYLLPQGAVLVVGSGQSGAQIAEELNESGRKVFLSVGSAGRIPRRYRGKDGFDWTVITGFLDRTADVLPSPANRFIGNPHWSGKNGGHSLNLHKFCRDGIVLLGHVQTVENGVIKFAPDLKENLKKVDKFETDFVNTVDAAILIKQIQAPPEELPAYMDGFSAKEIFELNVVDENIKTVIWAGGMKFDFSLVKFPIFDEYGYPVETRGKTAVRGLYFLGLPWLHTMKSGTLFGVGGDAEFIANDIAHWD